MIHRKQPFTAEEFRSLYSQVPRLCVDLVIKTSKGTLLTLRQENGWVGMWHLPGGTVHMYEQVEDTINRIAMEELNMEIKVIKLLGYVEYHSEITERGYGYSISLVFLCEPLSQAISLDDQTSEYRFFTKMPDKLISEQKVFLDKHSG